MPIVPLSRISKAPTVNHNSGKLRCFHVSMLLKDSAKDAKPLQYCSYTKDPWKALEEAMLSSGKADAKGSDFKLLEMMEEIEKDSYVIAFSDITRKMAAYIKDDNYDDYDDLPLPLERKKERWEIELEETITRARVKNNIERASAASSSKPKKSNMKPHIVLVAEDKYFLPKYYTLAEDTPGPITNG